MKRQIAAHSDHIKDVLEVQGKELNRIHERALDESLSNQNASHKQELAKIKGWLDALEQSMVERNTMAQAVFESQKFSSDIRASLFNFIPCNWTEKF